MRAWAYTHCGPVSSILHLTSDLPTPRPSQLKPDEAIIKISHVGLSVGMCLGMRIVPCVGNWLGESLGRGEEKATKWIPENEISGWIVALGSSTSGSNPSGRAGSENHDGFNIGDAVLAFPPISHFFLHNGKLTEYVVLPRAYLVRCPRRNASMAEAAALSSNGFPAIQALELALGKLPSLEPGSEEISSTTEDGKKKNKRVLVNGASGGIGTLAVQIAKRYFARDGGAVVAICSGRNVEMVKKIGADEVSCFGRCHLGRTTLWREKPHSD